MAKEVDLVIRAQNEATKAIDAVRDAIKGLAGDSDTLGKSAEKLGGPLGRFSAELNRLRGESQSLDSLNKVSDIIKTIGERSDRARSAVEKSASALADLQSRARQAADNTAKLRAQLDGAERALAANAKNTKELRSAQTAANAEWTKAEAKLKRLEQRLNAATTPNANLQKQVDDQRAIVDALTKTRDAARNAYSTQKVEQDKAAKSLAALNSQIAGSLKNERDLATEITRTSKSHSEAASRAGYMADQLNRAKEVAAQTQSQFGELAIDQQRIARASADVAAEINRVTAAMQRQNQINQVNRKYATPVDLQVERVQQAQKVFQEAQQEVNRFARALKDGAAPEEMERLARSFDMAKAQAQDASRAFKAETDQLYRLKSAAQTTFAEFSKNQPGRAFDSRMVPTPQKTPTIFDSQMLKDAAAYQARLRETAAQLRNVSAEATRTGGSLSQAGKSTGVFSAALASIYGEGRQSLSLMQRLRGEILSLTATYIGFQAAFDGLRSVIDSFRAVEAAQNRLGAVFQQNNIRVGQEINFLRAQAQRLGIEFATLSDEYGKFAVASNAANFSQENTRKIFLAVAEAGRVNKLSNEQLQGAFLALQQMISKGKISAQELQQQLGERIPGAVTIMAQALGYSNAELIKLQETGSLLATEGNMLKFADELTRRFGPQLTTALKSTTTEIGRFQNALFNAALQVAAGGFIESFTEMLRKLNELLSSQEGAKFFLGLGAAMGRVVDGITYLIDNFEALKAIMIVIVGIKLGGVFSNVVASLRATSAQLVATNGQFADTQKRISTLGSTFNGFRNTILAARRDIFLTSSALRAMDQYSVETVARISAMRGAMFALTGSLRIARVAFTALWAAIGGLPGIILTGVTVAIGAWATKVDETTAAIEEHKRIMNGVLAAYETVKGSTKEWAEELKRVNTITSAQAIDNANKLRSVYNDAVRELEMMGRVAKTAFNDAEPTDARRVQGTRISLIIEELKNGTADLKDVQNVLNEIALNPADETFKQIALDMLNLINTSSDGRHSLIELKQAFDEAEAVVRAFTGTATEADKATLGASAAQAKATDTTDKWKESTDQINEALAEAGKLIPNISNELERLGKIDALNIQYQNALKLAKTMSEVEAITRRFQSAADAINIDYGNKATSSFVQKVVGVESEGITTAKNPESTATGLGQFIESTWLSMFKKYFPDRAASMTDAMILELRKQGEISIKMVELYAKENAAILQKAGVAVNDASLYLAHFLGPDGAVKVLTASANTPVSSLLAPQVIDANKRILEGKTAGDVTAWAARKMNITQTEVELQKQITEEVTKQKEKAAEYNEGAKERQLLLEDELANNGKISREMAIQKAANEELQRAKEAGVTADPKVLETIKQAAAAEWDRTNALKSGKLELQQGNQLLALASAKARERAAIESQLKAATAAGNTSMVTQLSGQLTTVNTQLTEAIAKAREFWQAQSGPQADAALAKLNALAVKQQQVNTQFHYFGLNTSQISSLVGSFADGIAGAFDNFITAVANGENAMKALKNAFLQFAASFLKEIAMMIIKQMVLNALSGMGGPIGTAAKALAAGTGHIGGVVGSGSIGSGNNRKNVSPAIFSMAARYHNGGIGGLRPDEVPAVLRQGEEVITESDPRHRGNGGLIGQAAAPQTIRNIVTLDPEFARSMMASSDGEKIVMSHVRKNRASLKQLVNG